MPRPKSYDRQNALEKACKAFWEHGYQALGVRELEKITGINQFALRSDFGGKEGLYLEALQYYCDTAILEVMAPIRIGAIPEIIEFFHSLVAPGSIVSSEFGCLVVNTGIENSRVQSPRLERAANAYWRTLEDHFCQALTREQQLQKGAARFQPEELAKALIPAVMGIHAQNRSQKSHKAGRHLVDLVCATLSELRAQ